jgi:acyl carrier protein
MTLQTYITERTRIVDQVKEMMIRQLNLDLSPQQLDNDAPLFGAGLGLDSVDALELIVGLEQEFDVMIEEGKKTIFRSVNSIADYVQTQRH